MLVKGETKTMKRRIPFFCRLVVLQLLSVFLFIGCGSDNSLDFSTSEQVGVKNGEPTPENGEVNNGDDGDNGAGGGAGESEGEDNGGTIGVNSRAVFEFEYDRISQLVGVSLGGKPLASYSFDPAGNLTNLTLNGLEKEFSYNTLNQVTEASFDSKGQTTAQSSEGRTFEWNEQGQVTAIIQGNRRTELGYDGSARRTTITEIIDGGVESKKHYSWLGGRLMCERDGLKTGFPITKRYLGQGLIVTPEGEGEPGAVTTKLYYLTDHLGSVVQVVDDKDQTRAEYRYSIYGERVKVSGDLDIDFGFAGLFHHEPSGLDLATYRLYDPEQRRFISRDPLGEAVDYNLYRYAGNNPVNYIDPAGLKKCDPLDAVIGDPNDLDADTWSGSDDVLNADNWGNGDLVAQSSIDVTLTEAIATRNVAMLETLLETSVLNARQVQIAKQALALINKANHIFGSNLAKHKLSGVLAAFGGDSVAALGALETATTAAVGSSATGTFQTVVTVAGYQVTVRGAIVNGVARIGTAFIP